MITLRNSLLSTCLISPFIISFLYQYRPMYSHKIFEDKEEKILSKYIKSNYSLSDIKISNNQYIHTLFIDKDNYNKNKPNLVLVHGWSSGLALWSKNIDKLSNKYNVYAIDLLGFGRSGRPYFPRAPNASPEDAKEFWINSFHEWKKEIFGDDKIILLGHSLGGFLACTYAIEYSNDLEYVILAAPVGIAPFIIPKQTGFIRNSLQYLIWNIGITPQSILRSFGYFSHSMWSRLGNLINYRGLDEDSWEYLYQAQMGEPSGDRAFMNLLQKEGWGYPLYDKLKDIKIPLRVIYGSHDYVRPDFGPKIIEQINNVYSDFIVINNAGHHMYWTHPDEFTNSILSIKE